MFRQAKAVCNRPPSRTLYTSAQTGNYNCRHQGILKVASHAITWRCWYDGPLAGPITTRWGVWAPPTIFVLDKAGGIRFKDVRGADLDRAVAVLLDEAHVEKPAPR